MVGLVEQLAPVELPARVAARRLDLGAHLEVRLLPLQQHLARLRAQTLHVLRLQASQKEFAFLYAILFVSSIFFLLGESNSLENGLDVDDFGDALGQLVGDALHERHHALVLVVVARYDPDHAQGVHHGGQRLADHVKRRAVADVLEVALEGGQEAHVVLGLAVELGQVLALVVEARGGRTLDEREYLEYALDARLLGLLEDAAQRDVPLLPVVDLGERSVARRHLVVLRLERIGQLRLPLVGGRLQSGYQQLVVLHTRQVVGQLDVGYLQAHLALYLPYGQVNVIDELLHGDEEVVAQLLAVLRLTVVFLHHHSTRDHIIIKKKNCRKNNNKEAAEERNSLAWPCRLRLCWPWRFCRWRLGWWWWKAPRWPAVTRTARRDRLGTRAMACKSVHRQK